MNILDMLNEGTVKVALESSEKREAIAELVELLVRSGLVTDRPGVLDAMFTLLLLLGLDCLRRSDFAGWAIASVLASLLFYAGWVFFLLTAVAAWLWQPRLRRQITTAALGGAVVLVVILGGYLLVGWAEGSLWGWWSTLQRECFHRHFAPGPRLQSIALFAGYFLLGCGVVPAAGVLRGFRKKQTGPEAAWRRTVTSAVLAYLLIVMLSGNKNLHYLGPLLPIPLILWLKHPGDAAGNVGSRWAAPLSATAGLAVCIFICWPAARPVFTLNRQLGSVTTFRTDSYEEACRWGRLAGPLFDRGDFGWQIGEHTWVGYSQLDAEALRPRPLLVTDRDPPSEDYRLVLESTEFKGARLYSRDRRLVQWLSGRRPPTAAVRFPPVFRPIAPRETCRGAIGTTEETFLNSRPPGRRRLPGPSRR